MKTLDISDLAEQKVIAATRLHNRTAVDVDAHLRPYRATDAVASEIQPDLMRIELDTLNGTIDHIGIQRGIALRLFANFDRLRDQWMRGEGNVQPEEFGVMGAAITSALTVLAESIAEREAAAEPIAA